MTPRKRKELENRRVLLLQKLQAKEFVETRIRPFIEILQVLEENRVPFKIVRMVNIPPEWKPFMDELLSESPFVLFGLDKVPQADDHMLIHELLDCYPSVHAFRYVPDLQSLPPGTSLRAVAAGRHTGDETIYFSYFAYPFVLEVALSGLTQADETELFNFWHGDAVIFPKNRAWLMAYSLEGEWRYGKKTDAV